MKNEVRGAQGCLMAVVLFLAVVTAVVMVAMTRIP